MVELYDADLFEEARPSSKGNQLKWKTTDDHWYKADGNGYEGLAEYVVSSLLSQSDLQQEEFVHYETERILYKKVEYRGCKSKDFLASGEQLFTLERLFRQQYGSSLYKAVFQIPDVEGRLMFLTEQVEQLTGLSAFGIYLEKMFTIDAFFLNEDRHTHNIAVISCPDGNYRLCPIFDQGASLLSDTTMDYPLGEDICNLIPTVKSKTIAWDFDEQLDAADKAYGCQLSFHFSKKYVHDLLAAESYYPDEVKDRVEKIIYSRMRKFQYLFE